MSELRPFDRPYPATGVNLRDFAPPPPGLGRVPLVPASAPLSSAGVSLVRPVSWPAGQAPADFGELSQAEPAASIPSASCSREILAAHYVRKSYRKASIEIPVLQGVELAIREGEFVSIIGASGCGKSTLLHVLATLDAPDSGEIRFEGHRIDNLASAGRDILRNKYFGMVFQFYHLLPELTTLENVLAPAMIGEGVLGYWRRKRQYRERAREMLELVGLGHRLKHKPRELSGGEMQRTAIARALVARPRVLLADEPTGNLDKATGEEIMAILRQLNREQNLTIVMVTHDPRIADQADRTVTLVDGRVVAA